MIYYVDVDSPLVTLFSAILLQFEGSQIIVIYNIVVNLVSLFFQEVSVSDHLCRDIVHFGKLGLSWSLSVQKQSGFNIGPSGSHGHESTSVTPNILVHRKFCINVPLYISRICILKGSMLVQCCLVIILLPLPVYFILQNQVISL